MKYIISDWTGAFMFDGKEFETFDDAETYLSIYLDDYDNDRQEYEILERDILDTGTIL